METPWIRGRDVPEYYCMGRSKAYELMAEFKAQADRRGWIQDGRVLLIRKEVFEEFLRGRNR